MGIPRFFTWLKKQNYPDVLQDGLPDIIDWLIFDTNSLFHQAHQITYSYADYFTKERALYVRKTSAEKLEKEFRDTLITLLTTVTNRVRPTKGILIAVDGIAPQAKIQQQRQRRYKNPRTSDKDPDEGPVDPEVAKLRKPIVDPNRITPGTDFMFRLDDFLRAWLKAPTNTLQLGVNKIIYSSHLVPGEGEHKYLELLRSGDIPSTGNHVIHGMDADLFILSLIAPVERIFITREDIDQVVNIQSFRHSLYRTMKHQTTPTDFAVLTFFLGNDFLPHQPSLLDMRTGIDTLIATYVQVGKPLTKRTSQGHVIIWENLLEFFRIMTTHESTLLANEAIKGFKYPSIAYEQALTVEVIQEEFKNPEAQARALRTQRTAKRTYTFSYETFRDYWYHHALGPRGDTTILDYLTGRDVYPITVERITEHCIAYLRGLAWNLAYYMDGWNKTSLEYVYPYHHTPLFSDLFDALEQQVKDSDVLDNIFRDEDESYNFNPVHQLLAVLPFESQDLLPLEVRTLMDESSPIYDMYPNQFIIDREATDLPWQGIALIPFAESDRIVAAVNDISFPAGRLKKYQAADNYVVRLEEQDTNLVRRQRDQMAKVQELFPSRRGRGIATMGRGESTRGRGTSVRGRGESTRGRGTSVRGRGEPTRGRGEPTRGRGSAPVSRQSPSQGASIEKKEEWRSARFL